MQGYNTFFTFSQLSLINYKYVPIYRGNCDDYPGINSSIAQ